MFNMDFVFSITSFETVVLTLLVLTVFVYTYVIMRHRTYTGPHVDTRAGDEGED